jgi:hypothetical protein
MVDNAQASHWYVLPSLPPSLPMFWRIPLMLKRGIGFWPALALGCAITMVLYALMVAALARWGIRL